MKRIDLLLSLASFITLHIAIEADSPNPLQPLCPNSPIQPTYLKQQPPVSSSSAPCVTNNLYILPSCTSVHSQSISCSELNQSLESKATPPPGEINVCAPGSMLLNGVCRLIHCGEQSILREGKCFRIECPQGAHWTGSRCESKQELVTHTFAFNVTMTTHIDSSSSPLIFNNVNNITVNTLPIIDTISPTPAIPFEKPTSAAKCCTVFTPRICKPKIIQNKKRWDCYSKRYHRCGEICIAPTVYLKPPYPSGLDDMLVLPPENHVKECLKANSCINNNETHDCSGCGTAHPENCSHYCYRYVCLPHHCKYYSQQDFCKQYPGEHGCTESDGCFEDWCDSKKRDL